MGGPSRRRGSDMMENQNGSLALRGALLDTPSANDESDNGGLKLDLKEYIAAMNRLQTLGVKSLPVPKIVVVGDQSAGKSSLVEAISRIRVPRSTGTCIRCPIQISLANDPDRDWSCKISLQKSFDYDHLSGRSNNPFWPWTEKHIATTTGFGVVYNEADLEEMILRAQLATLSPWSEPMEFVQGEIKDTKRREPVEFSPNTIRLEITGKGLPDLAFYDLPGIISQPDQVDQAFTVDLVRRLAAKYMSDDMTIILLACSLESDAASSSAAGLVQTIPGAVNRCMGVLTKADRIAPGNEAIVASILGNKKFELTHGYYVTRLLGQLDLNKYSNEEMRTIEQDFFNKTAWAARMSREFGDRFGIEHLERALSRKLGVLIAKSLPDIQTQAQQQLKRITAELLKLPPPPKDDAFATVVNLLGRVASIMTKQTSGEGQSELLYSWQHGLLGDLKESIERLKPRLTFDPQSRSSPQPSAQRARKKQPRPSSRDQEGSPLDEDGDDIVMVSSSVRNRNGKRDLISRGRNPPSTNSEGHRFTIEEIRNTMNRFSLTAGIQGEMQPKALDRLRLQALECLDVPVKHIVDESLSLLLGHVTEAISIALSDWKGMKLFELATQLAQEFVREAWAPVYGDVMNELRLEQVKVKTEDNSHLDFLYKEVLTTMQDARSRRFAEEQLRQTMGENFEKLTEKQINDKVEAMRRNGSVRLDPYEAEVNIVAKVRAYYFLATSRLTDFIARHADLDLFELFRESELNGDLKSKFETTLLTLLDIPPDSLAGTTPVHHCQQLLAEDPVREEERLALEMRKNAMESALRCLEELQGSFAS